MEGGCYGYGHLLRVNGHVIVLTEYGCLRFGEPVIPVSGRKLIDLHWGIDHYVRIQEWLQAQGSGANPWCGQLRV